MPGHAKFKPSYQPSRRRSIRDELENLAWAKNPGLARRLARRLTRRATGVKPRMTSHDSSARRIMRWQDRVLLTLGIIFLVLFVIRTETAIANEEHWGLQLQGDSGAHTEMAIDTDIQVAITGLVARVEITQRFTNSGSYWAEGIYRFPLPAGAAVDRMLIRVGERVLEGEIQEKDVARRTYQQARETGRTATIVEQQRRNQFETRLANIGPGETIDITIGYLQNVEYRDLSFNLRLPMTFTPRWEPGSRNGETLEHTQPLPRLVSRPSAAGNGLTLRANLISAIDFAAIESRYHDVDIRQVDNGYQVDLLNPDQVTDRDFELSWTPSLRSSPAISLTSFNDGESVFAQLMLVPPLADSITPQAREVVLIIDTSGSMQGASMTQAKTALLHALDSLGPDDYFNLLQFNSSTERLFEQSVPLTPNSLQTARSFIQRLEANGGTNMAPALQQALSLDAVPQLMRQVVFITDGAVGNETQLLQQVAQNLGGSRMFTVAIGHAPNSWFMRKTAEIGRGSYVHIGKPEEVGQQMAALWKRIQLPALTDIRIEWGAGAEFYPEIVPDLYAGEPLWLLARLPAEPAMIGLYGQLDGLGWSLDINGYDAITSHAGGDTLAKLWARKKIEALQDGLLFGADRELTRLETTAVALEHGLLTRHTSLVAVDKTPRRKGSELLASSNIPGLLPAGGSARLAGYPNTATGWLSQLLLSLFVLLLATAMLLFSGSRLPMMKPAAKA